MVAGVVGRGGWGRVGQFGIAAGWVGRHGGVTGEGGMEAWVGG